MNSSSAPSASSSAAPAVDSAPKPADQNTGPAVEQKDSSVLDLVFLVDCTGSMASYIKSAQSNMHRIVETIVAAEKADVQVSVVGYRDFMDDWVTKVFDFERAMSKIKANIDFLSASGGGDTPEAVTAGLHEVNQLCYRKNSTRVVVLIADAPDHGLGELGDQYPDGDKYGRDPLQIAHELAAKGIVLYAVACEPGLSSTTYGRDFLMSLSKITQGQFLPLTSATLLADVIIGGAKEEISLQRIQEAVEKEADRVRQQQAAALGVTADKVSDADVAKEVVEALKKSGVVVTQVSVDDVYGGRYNMSNVDMMVQHRSLAAARAALVPSLNKSVQPMGISSPAPSSYPGGAGGPVAFGYGSAPPPPMPSVPYIHGPPPPSAYAPSFDLPSFDIPSYGMPPVDASLPMGSMAYPAAPPVAASYSAPFAADPAAPAPLMAQNAYVTSSSASYEQVQRVMNKVALRK